MPSYFFGPHLVVCGRGGGWAEPGTRSLWILNYRKHHRQRAFAHHLALGAHPPTRN